MPSLDWIGKVAVVNHHTQVPYRLIRCDNTPNMITPDANEKRMLGELWQARSNGRCLFALVGAHDYATRLRAMAS